VASREAEEPFVLAFSWSREAARLRSFFFAVSRSARLQLRFSFRGDPSGILINRSAVRSRLFGNGRSGKMERR